MSHGSDAAILPGCFLLYRLCCNQCMCIICCWHMGQPSPHVWVKLAILSAVLAVKANVGNPCTGLIVAAQLRVSCILLFVVFLASPTGGFTCFIGGLFAVQPAAHNGFVWGLRSACFSTASSTVFRTAGLIT
jgi:hypothetical protein